MHIYLKCQGLYLSQRNSMNSKVKQSFKLKYTFLLQIFFPQRNSWTPFRSFSLILNICMLYPLDAIENKQWTRNVIDKYY